MGPTALRDLRTTEQVPCSGAQVMFQYSPVLEHSSIWDLKYTFSKLLLTLYHDDDELGEVCFSSPTTSFFEALDLFFIFKKL